MRYHHFVVLQELQFLTDTSMCLDRIYSSVGRLLIVKRVHTQAG